MDWLQVWILALIQGLTEFLPISSSAHLILLPELTHWQDQGLAFDVALHIGSLAAVIIYFRRDIGQMIQSFFASFKTRQLDASAKLAWGVLLGTIPVGVFGLLFKDYISTEMRSPILLAWALIGFGLLLGLSDWRAKHATHAREVERMTWWDYLWIGLAQALALIPGTSRSGITMTAALFLGLSREAAARFSFLLSIPVIALAGLLETKTLISQGADTPWAFVIAGAIISGVCAYLCIHYFLAFIKRIGMQPFVIYRVILGVFLLWIFWLKPSVGA